MNPIKTTVMILTSVNCILLGYVLFEKAEGSSTPDPNNATSNHQIQQDKRQFKKETPTGTDNHPLPSFIPNQLTAQQILSIPFEKFEPLRIAIHNWLESDPEMALKWLEEISKELSDLNGESHAYELLKDHWIHAKVRNLGRGVVLGWLSRDFEGTIENIEKIVANGVETTDVDQQFVWLVASLTTNEHEALLPSLIAHLKEMDTPEMARIKGAITDGLVLHMTPGTLEQIKNLVEQNLDNFHVVGQVVPIADKIGINDPVKALEWSSSLRIDDKELHATAFAVSFEKIADKDPDLLAEIVSGDGFLENYYPGNAVATDGSWTPEAKDFFDLALESYLARVMLYEPQLALESVGAFFDEGKEEKFRMSIISEIKRIESKLDQIDPDTTLF